MKAIILSAGLGKRMRPLTFGKAKSSLPLFNKPFIFHAVEYLRRFGITEIAINLHHAPDSINSLLENGNLFDAKIRYSYENEILGTAGAIKRLEDFLCSETFVLMNSDFASDINLDEVIEYHTKEKAMATLVLQKSETSEYSKVKMGIANQIEALGVQNGHHIFCGMHIIEPDILQYIPVEKNVDINRDIYSTLIAKGFTLKAYEHNGYWFEFGNLERYFHGHMELAKKGIGFIEQILNVNVTDNIHLSDAIEESKPHSNASIFAAENFNASTHSRINGYLVAGEKCFLGADCFIKNSIIHNSVTISDRAEISNCIVGEQAMIPKGMKVHGSALALMPDEKIKFKNGEIKREGNLFIKRFLC